MPAGSLRRPVPRSLCAWGMAILSTGICLAQADGTTLSVAPGPFSGEFILTWTGGQPLLEIYRSHRPMELVQPDNKIGETTARAWDDKPPAGEIFFYRITGPCVVDPPERCDGVDNDCDGTVDGPGSEASCSLANATPVCASGNCAIDACEPGFEDCDGAPATGCEVDPDNDPIHCGACGLVCDLTHATAVCASGLCDIDVCDPLWEDCDATAAPGCETSLTTLADCGACGNVCMLANATSTCASGSCAISVCDAGFADCDAAAITGCEVDLDHDAANCGTCGFTCDVANATASCAGGSCAHRDANGGDGIDGSRVRSRVGGRIRCEPFARTGPANVFARSSGTARVCQTSGAPPSPLFAPPCVASSLWIAPAATATRSVVSWNRVRRVVW